MSIRGSRTTFGEPGKARAMAVEARIPMRICPSAPMFRMPLRKEIAMPRPTRISGMARTRTSVTPNLSAKGPVKMVV